MNNLSIILSVVIFCVLAVVVIKAAIFLLALPFLILKSVPFWIMCGIVLALLIYFVGKKKNEEV